MEENCPVCLKATNRLVKESCGHFKCRTCLIEEEFGCKECINATKQITKPEDTLKNFVTLQNVNNTIDEIQLQQNETIQYSSHPQPELIKKIAILEDIPITIRQSGKSTSITESTKTQLTNGKISRPMPAHIIRVKDEGGISYKCLICNKSFNSRTQQYYHLYCNEAYKKPYFCTVCFKRFSSSYHLKYHEEIHNTSNKNLTCPKCKKIFTRSITLEKHLRNQHQQRNTYTCSKCNTVFKDKYAYNGHCKKHDNIYPFSCEYCEKSFSLKSNFKQHQLVHCGKTSYECTECKKRFKRKNSYKVHMLRHTNEKNFVCNLCKKVFSDPKSLYRHVKIHDDSAFYKCAFCPVKSKRKDNLSRHIRNMHPEEDVQEGVQQEENLKIDSSKPIVFEVEKSNEFTQKSEEKQVENNLIKTNIIENAERLQKCSVIKSIGNVKPVIIASEEDCTNIKVNVINPVEEVNNQQNLPSKKRKKKYDPCEIYRKILFANEEDSISDASEPEESVNNQNSDVNEKKGRIFESNIQLNFGEVHWRKRTSQYFSSINA